MKVEGQGVRARRSPLGFGVIAMARDADSILTPVREMKNVTPDLDGSMPMAYMFDLGSLAFSCTNWSGPREGS